MSTGRRFLVCAAVAATALTACGSGDSKSGSSTSTSASSRTSTTTTTAAACANAAWTDVTSTWTALATQPLAEGRQQVADDLAALRRGQDTSEVGQVSVAEVRTGEPLVVVLSETGVPDVSVARVDTEITLEGGDEGWSVTSARQRSICAG
jgi:hypothetical protein